MTEYTKYTFFFQSASPFSQFHPAEFEEGGVKFVCAEQAMMYKKAMLFDAPDTAKLILACLPNEQQKMKSYGRKGIPKFDEKVWEKHRKEYIKANNLAKFRQNEGLRKQLFDTKDTLLVEASPYDRIWGIGFSAKDAMANKNRWGKNLLGKILTEVREELMKEFKEEDDPKTPEPPIPISEMTPSQKKNWKRKMAKHRKNKEAEN